MPAHDDTTCCSSGLPARSSGGGPEALSPVIADRSRLRTSWKIGPSDRAAARRFIFGGLLLAGSLALASLAAGAFPPFQGTPISALASFAPRWPQQTSNAEQKQEKGSQPGGATNSTRAAKLFERDCAHCHGANGDGNSPVRSTLHPEPLDLTSFQVSNAYTLQVLHDGIPGSDMPAWHVSPEKDLRDEADYTSHLAKPAVLSDQERYATPEQLSEAGKRVYEAHCARCHGTAGNGDGPDARKYRPRPPSFAGMQPSFAGAQHVIQNGVAGTAMPAWTLLTPPEIQAVTFYIRTFYNDGTATRSSTAASSARTGAQP